MNCFAGTFKNKPLTVLCCQAKIHRKSKSGAPFQGRAKLPGLIGTQHAFWTCLPVISCLKRAASNGRGSPLASPFINSARTDSDCGAARLIAAHQVANVITVIGNMPALICDLIHSSCWSVTIKVLRVMPIRPPKGCANNPAIEEE